MGEKISIRFVIVSGSDLPILKCLLCESIEQIGKPYGVKICKKCGSKGMIAQFEDKVTKDVIKIVVERLNRQDTISALSKMLDLPHVLPTIECLVCGFQQSVKKSDSMKVCRQCHIREMLAPIGSLMDSNVLTIPLNTLDRNERIKVLDKLTEMLYADLGNESNLLGSGSYDEEIRQILKKSDKHLESKKEMLKISNIIWLLHSMEDIRPITVEKSFDHMFPIWEANYELGCSIQLCRRGFYKHALVALRSVLELGLVSVYYDIENNSQIKLKEWLKSSKYTPSTDKIYLELEKNQNIKSFNMEHDLFNQIKVLFQELSGFVHTRGLDYSSNTLAKANFNRFNEESLSKWADLLVRTTKIVIIVHLLKYPVGLQHTPLEQKFGLNPPVGGFLEPIQREKIERFLDDDVLNTLQKISDSDAEAVALAKWVNDRPDITMEEMQRQADELGV